MNLLEMPVVWVIGGIYATIALGYLTVFIVRARAEGEPSDDDDEEI